MTPPYLADGPPIVGWWPPYPYLPDAPPPPHGWIMCWVKLVLVLYVWRQDRMRPARQGLPFIYNEQQQRTKKNLSRFLIYLNLFYTKLSDIIVQFTMRNCSVDVDRNVLTLMIFFSDHFHTFLFSLNSAIFRRFGLRCTMTRRRFPSTWRCIMLELWKDKSNKRFASLLSFT